MLFVLLSDKIYLPMVLIENTNMPLSKKYGINMKYL